MKIFFARHGETKYNLENRFQGVSDSELTQKGIYQARKLRQFIINNEIKNALISPLERSTSTYKLASENIKMNCNIIQELREVCYGSWETKLKAEIMKTDQWEKRNNDKFNFIHPGDFAGVKGESYSTIYKRITPFITKLVESQPTENIIVISHIGVIRCLHKLYSGLSDNEAANLEIPNAHITVIDTTKSPIKINKDNP